MDVSSVKKLKSYPGLMLCFLFVVSAKGQSITTGTFLKEMIDLEHLTTIVGPKCRTIQFRMTQQGRS